MKSLVFCYPNIFPADAEKLTERLKAVFPGRRIIVLDGCSYIGEVDHDED